MMWRAISTRPYLTESSGDRDCRLPTKSLTGTKRTWAPGGEIKVVIASPDLSKWGEPRTILPLEEGEAGSGPVPKVGRCRLTLSNPRRKRLYIRA